MTRSRKFSSRKHRPAPRPPRARLEIEALEERTLLSVVPIMINGMPAPEFLVNQNAAQFQQDTTDQKLAVAAVPTGGFVVAYRSVGQDGAGDGVFARRFDAAGQPLGNEFQVNTFTSNDQYAPAVAVAPDGSFLIAYTSIGEEDTVNLPFSRGVFARRFDAAGNPLGAEFRVNTTTFLAQSLPSVGFAGDGSFVIAWQSFSQDGDGFGIFAQRFDRDGNVVGGEIPVNVTTTGDQEAPALAVRADGSFIVTWDGRGHQGGINLGVILPGGDGSPPPTGEDVDQGIFACVFAADGTPLTSEFQVSASSGGQQQATSVAVGPGGNFLIVWQSTGQDSPNSDGIFARLFNVNNTKGTALSDEFQVNSSAPYGQDYPTVAADADGNFLVTWSSYGQDNPNDPNGPSYGIYARQFSPTGDPLNDEFLVNTVTAGEQSNSSVAIGSGTAVVVYSGNGPDDSQGVFARRFRVNSTADDDFAQAPEVGLGGLYSFNSVQQTGIINQDARPDGDRDIFHFLATVGGKQTVGLDSATGSSLTGVLQVYDSQQQLVASDTGRMAEVTFDVIQGQTYYVAVTGTGGSTGAYVLTFGPSLNSPLDGTLSPAGMSPAAPLPPSLKVPQQLSDRLDADAARDGFTPALVPLVVDQNGRLSAGLHTDGFAARLSLFDAQGNLLIQSDGQSPTNHDPLILQQLTGNDFGTRYYLEVERLGLGGTGGYTLTTHLEPAGDPLQPVSVGHNATSFDPEAVTTADFNGDGIPDVAAGDIDSGTVAIFLGNGDGSVRFGGQVTVDPAGGAFPGFLLTADFNNDGYADLAVVDSSNVDVSVLLGNGDGTFQSPKFLPVGGGQSDLVAAATGDFNGDGILDLAVTDDSFDLVYIALGHDDGIDHGDGKRHGDGTFRFAPPPFLSLDIPGPGGAKQQPSYGITSADFNHDDIADLAVTVTNPKDSTGRVVILKGNGNGTFTEVGRFAAGLNPFQVAAKDFNSDGILDLVVVNDGSRNLSVLLGNDDGTGHGDGTFRKGDTVLLHGSGPIGLVVTDFNRDGHFDVAVNSGSNFVDVLLGDGHGHFQSAPGLGGFSVGDVPFSLAVANLNDDNGDGLVNDLDLPDLITADDTGKDVSISLGKGNGTFKSPAFVDVGQGGYDVAAGDVNKDGLLDVVTANAASGDVTLLLGSSTGTFREGDPLPADGLPYSVLLIDVNKDGKLDVVTANAGSNDVSVFLGNGDGSFGDAQDFDTGGMMGDDRGVLAAGDFNGDGRLDLAVANGVSGDVSLLLGNGAGSFQLAGQVAVGGRPSSLVAADLNGDGKTDLAVTTGAAGAVVLLLGNGNGTFLVGQRVVVGGRARSLAAADLNGDGRIDLAVTVDAVDGKSVSQAMVLLNNNGKIQITNPTSQNSVGISDLGFGVSYVLEGFAATAIRAADVSGDGKPDLVVTESGSASVDVLLNNGNGTFGPVQRLRAGERPWAVALGDFNGDGRPDLAVTDPFQAKVTVLPGLGGGAFQTERTALLGTSPVALAAGDFNNDGQKDVVAANFASNDVSVLLGNGDGSFEVGRRVPVGKGPKAIVAADFNRDGRLDLAVADSGSNDLAILLGNGDGTFRDAGRIALGSSPTLLVTADLNGDGKPDLVVNSATDSRLTVLLGNGDGSFQSGGTLALSSPAISLAVGDLNHDSVPDLAVLDLAANGDFSDQVTILLGKGNGTFTELATHLQISSGNNPGPASVFVTITQLTDDNFDGVVDESDNPDIITADLGNNTSTIFLGAGDGRFVRDPQFDGGAISAINRPVALAITDLDGDGFPDLISADPSDNLLDIEFGDGQGDFPFYEDLSASVAPVAVLALDLNGDGHPDLITANRDSGDLSVFLGLGDGSGAFFPADQGTAPRRATPLVGNFAPVQGEAQATDDVAVLGRDGRILLRRGVAGSPGTFQPPEVVNPSDRPARDLVKLSKSGQVALAALDIKTPTISLYAFDPASGQFMRKPGVDLSAARDPVTDLPLVTGLLPVRLLAADLDGDGRDDLVVLAAGAGTSSRAFVYLQNADGTFPADPSYTLQTGASPSDVTLADLDGDGRKDLVVTNRYSGDVSVFLNKADAPFAQEQRYRAGTGPYSLGQQVGDSSSPLTVQSRQGTIAVVAGPFDGDKNLDLLVLNRDAASGSVLLGDGTGGLFNPTASRSVLLGDGSGGLFDVASQTFNAGGDPTALVGADFNGDGRRDLAVLDRAAGLVRVFLGHGDGTFARGQILSVGPFASGLSVANVVDQGGGQQPDGAPDLLVGTEQGDVLILAGDGKGNFTQFLRRGQTVSLAVADLNGDGIPDALTANQSRDQAAVQVRLPGTTTLTTVRVDPTDAGPGNIKYQDVNADGIPDRIVVNSVGNSIQVFLGLPGGNFAPAQTFGAGTNPTDVLFAQLNDDNHDGKIDGSDFLDLLVVNHGSNDLSVLFGSGTGPAWTLTPGPRLMAGSGPVAVLPVQDVDVRGLTGNPNAPGPDGIPDLRIVNQDGSITVLPGIGTAAGTGFFLDALSPLFRQTGAPTYTAVVLPPQAPPIDQVVLPPSGSPLFVTPDRILGGGTLPSFSLGGGQIRFVTSFGSDLFVGISDGRIVELGADLAGGLAVFADAQLGGLSSLQIVPGADNLEAYYTIEGDSTARVFDLLRPEGVAPTPPPPFGPPPDTLSAVALALDAASTRLVQALVSATLTDRTTAAEGSAGTGFVPSNPSLRQGDGEREDEESNAFLYYWRLLKEVLQIPEPNPVSLLVPQLVEALTITEQGVEATASAAVKPLAASGREVLETLQVDLPAVATAIPPSLAEFPRELVEALDRSFEAVGDDLLQRFLKGNPKSEIPNPKEEEAVLPSDLGFGIWDLGFATAEEQGAEEVETTSNQETVLGEEEATGVPTSLAPIPVEQWVKASLVAAGGWLALWHGRGRVRNDER